MTARSSIISTATNIPIATASDPLEHRAEGLAMLATLEARLASQAYLCGANRTLADAAIMPFVRQFAAVDRDWFDGQPLPALQRWLAVQLAAPLFAEAMIVREPWRGPLPIGPAGE
jgi:glutathione S-transferase